MLGFRKYFLIGNNKLSQIKSGKKLTITDPQMTRFMMSLEQSVDLVEFAFNNAKPGDIFVMIALYDILLSVIKALIALTSSSSFIDTGIIIESKGLYC